MSAGDRSLSGAKVGGAGPGVDIEGKIYYNFDVFKELHSFPRYKQNRVIRRVAKKVLGPSLADLKRDPVPLSEGQSFIDVMTRKAKHGWKTDPDHARESAKLKIRKSRYRPNALFVQLTFNPGMRWYMQILASGFTDPGGGAVQPEGAVKSVIDKADRKLRFDFELKLLMEVTKVLRRDKKRAEKKRKREFRG